MRLIGIPLVAFVSAGCTLANVGPQAAERQTQRAVFTAAYDDVYRAALQQAGAMKWAILFADHAAGAVRVATPATLGAWADTIAVNVTRADTGTAVLVRSTLGQSPNRKNIERFLRGVSARLAPAKRGEP